LSEITTIQVNKETRELLKSCGHKGETYDELINRLIKTAKKVAFFEDIDRILETEEFVSLDDL
jgi:hypothetical protein